MAKTAKVKKREVSFHSRAARRAASPSLDLDPSLRKPTSTTRQRSTSPSRSTKPLAAQNAGIQKKQKKSNLTRAQRLRHQKGLERAADVLDKRQVKVVKSLGKEKVVKERAKGWEDVNGEGAKKKVKKDKNGFEGLDGEEWEDVEGKKERKWGGDEDMDDAEAGGDGAVKSLDVEPESVPLPVEEDELL